MEFHALIIKYKALMLLNTMFNESYCRFIIPNVKYLGSVFSMVCALAASRFRNEHTLGSLVTQVGVLLMATYSYTMLIISAHLMSDFWQTSGRFVWWLRHAPIQGANRSKYYLAAAKGLAPLRFKVGGLYAMEKSAKLTLAGLLAFGTGKVLIALN